MTQDELMLIAVLAVTAVMAYIVTLPRRVQLWRSIEVWAKSNKLAAQAREDFRAEAKQLAEFEQ